MNRHIHGNPGGLATGAVDNSEDLLERPAGRLRPAPAGHAFRDDIEIGHVARGIGAEYRVADAVQGDFGARCSLEQRLLRRSALDGGTESSRKEMAVDMITQQIVLSAELQGPPGELLLVRRTEDQDWYVGCGPQDLLDAHEADVVGYAEIDQDGRDAASIQSVETSGQPSHPFDGERAVSCVRERLPHQVGVSRIIRDE